MVRATATLRVLFMCFLAMGVGASRVETPLGNETLPCRIGEVNDTFKLVVPSNEGAVDLFT